MIAARTNNAANRFGRLMNHSQWAAANNWSPFQAEELPPSLVADLSEILKPLYLASLELHRTVYRYELFAALGRSRDFVNKINRSTSAPALNTVKGCVTTTLVMSLCAFFDEDGDAVNVRRILNRVLKPEYDEAFREFHSHQPFGRDAVALKQRLIRMQRRLNRGRTAAALARLRDLRNQIVAHLAIDPNLPLGHPALLDITLLLAAVTNLVVSLVRYVIATRDIAPSIGRDDAQEQARSLCNAIQPTGYYIWSG
jgi:AbiU2